jgi:hypothetical protein
MEKRTIVHEIFPNFQKQDAYFDTILGGENAWKRILVQYAVFLLLTMFYGIVMGSYHGVLQAVSTGVKVPVLFSLTLIVCCPAFLIIQLILGSKLRLSQMISILLSGFVLTSSIMLAFLPIVVFFQLTGGNYYFLILLHLAIWALSGFFGMTVIINALKFSCEKKNIYPHTGVVVFRFWIVILAFVGIQLAWNLRPFLGNRQEPFKLLRKYEGNFYTAIIYSIQQLADTDKGTIPDPSNDAGTSGSKGASKRGKPLLMDEPFLLDEKGEERSEQ